MSIARHPAFPFAAFAFALSGGLLTSIVYHIHGALRGVIVAFLVLLLFIMALSDGV